MRRGPKRYLLGHLAAKGDCLYATTIARQIKHEDPDSHLTWAIGSSHRAVIDNNPDVDEVWEVPLAGHQDVPTAWAHFTKEARARGARGEFDEMFFTQLFPANFGRYDGTVRASILRGYPGPITVPVTPVVRLTERELENASAFATRHRLAERRHVVLFESAALSGQSFLTPEFALEAARLLVRDVPGTCVILSSAKRFDSGSADILDGSTLAFRENAALTHSCSMLVGCSSGITWLATSEAARQIPMVQLLSKRTCMYGAVVHDLEYWRLPSDHVIEMRDCSLRHAANCLAAVLTGGVAEARRAFHEPLKLDFTHYWSTMLPRLKHGRVPTVARSLANTVGRYGLRWELATGLVRTAARLESK